MTERFSQPLLVDFPLDGQRQGQGSLHFASVSGLGLVFRVWAGLIFRVHGLDTHAIRYSVMATISCAFYQVFTVYCGLL